MLIMFIFVLSGSSALFIGKVIPPLLTNKRLCTEVFFSLKMLMKFIQIENLLLNFIGIFIKYSPFISVFNIQYVILTSLSQQTKSQVIQTLIDGFLD